MAELVPRCLPMLQADWQGESKSTEGKMQLNLVVSQITLFSTDRNAKRKYNEHLDMDSFLQVSISPCPEAVVVFKKMPIACLLLKFSSLKE